MKKLLTVSLVAMMAVSAARADIASTDYVTDRTGDVAASTYVSGLANKTLTGAVSDLDSRVTAVKGTADAAATAADLTALQGTVSTNKAAADQTQASLEALAETVAGINTAYKAADTTLTNKFGDLGEKTVQAYVDDKTKDIASSGTVSALASRVDTAKTDIDGLQASLAEGGATATAIAAAKKAGDDAQGDLDAYKTSNNAALAGVKATADAALPTTTFTSFQNTNTQAIATAKSEAIADAASKYQVKALVTSQTEMNAAANKAAVYPSASLMESFVNDKTTGLVTGLGGVDSLETTAENVVGAINEVKDTADSALAKAEANEDAIDGLGALARKSTIATADIDAKAVTLEKLADGVQTSLGLANSAVQSVTTGTGNGNINVDGTQVAVSGLKSAAFAETTAFDSVGSAATAKSEAIAAAKTETESQISALGLTAVSKVAVPTECENGQATCALVYDSVAKDLKWEAIMK